MTTNHNPTRDTEIDRISLEQAIADFEVANARTIDLMSRLVSTTEELAEARREASTWRARAEEQRTEIESLWLEIQDLQTALLPPGAKLYGGFSFEPTSGDGPADADDGTGSATT